LDVDDQVGLDQLGAQAFDFFFQFQNPAILGGGGIGFRSALALQRTGLDAELPLLAPSCCG
jgi:hypothetical protein